MFKLFYYNENKFNIIKNPQSKILNFDNYNSKFLSYNPKNMPEFPKTIKVFNYIDIDIDTYWRASKTRIESDVISGWIRAKLRESSFQVNETPPRKYEFCQC